MTTCPHDTDGDGNCQHCWRSGGCYLRPPRPGQSLGPVKVLLNSTGEPLGVVLPEPADDRAGVIKRYRPGMIIEAAGGHLLGLPHTPEPDPPIPHRDGYGIPRDNLGLPIKNEDDFAKPPFYYDEEGRLKVRWQDGPCPTCAAKDARIKELEERVKELEGPDPLAPKGSCHLPRRRLDSTMCPKCGTYHD